MKFLVVLVLLSSIGTAEEGQLHKRISVDYREAPIGAALKDIADMSGVHLDQVPSSLASSDPVTYVAVEQEAGRVLTHILRPRGYRLALSASDRTGLEKLDAHDEMKVKRRDVFEFTEKPTVARAGAEVTIAFASKDLCDCTVAIENAEGKIIRHLASGVLGDNAPEPFVWNSAKQSIVWDGKNDQGEYVTDLSGISARVSLGLDPRFERTMFWSPHKRIGNSYPGFSAAPEGVYVSDAQGVEHVRLFDHQGNYLRTVYPFPANQVARVAGLKTHAFIQDGKTLPLKSGEFLATMLTCGANMMGITMASNQGKLACVNAKLNRLAADGSSGGLPFEGPQIALPAEKDKYCPLSAAFSPDGEWLYLTGYTNSVAKEWQNCVMRMSYADNAEPTIFAGEKSIAQRGAPATEGKFNVPTSVACDDSGRVYVSDYVNDRVQIFAADGKFLKAIAVKKPVRVQVQPKTGDIHVFSWLLILDRLIDIKSPVDAAMIHLGPFDNPVVRSTVPLPLPGYSPTDYFWSPSSKFRVEIDWWAEQPTVWIINGDAGGIGYHDDGSIADVVANAEFGSIRIFSEKDGKLEPKRNFADDVKKTVVRQNPPVISRQRLTVNPSTGKCYILEGDSGVMKSVNQLVELDPETGKAGFVDLPLGAEDLCFDISGLLYIRTDILVARYEMGTWREIPWDYGEEVDNHSFGMGARAAHVTSALIFPGHRSGSFWHSGGVAISPKGHLAVSTCNLSGMSGPAWRTGEAHFELTGRPYQPKIYPGRMRWGEIHIFDRYGKMIGEDCIPGMAHMNGLKIDRDDNLYALSNSQRLIDGKLFDPTLEDATSCTLLKAASGSAKIVSNRGADPEIPAPLPTESQPARTPDLRGNTQGSSGWVDGADWLFGGVGFGGRICICWNCRFDADYFGRSFAPEPLHCSVAVLDSNGNLILRVGKYGNIEDGRPLIAEGGPADPNSIGGDEVALDYACYVATHSDRRLFIADAGNARIISVKLGYHVSESVTLNAK